MRGLKLVETAELKGVRGEEVGGGGEEEGSKVSKVYEKESAFYLSWFNLEHNLKFKIVCASSGQTKSRSNSFEQKSCPAIEVAGPFISTCIRLL